MKMTTPKKYFKLEPMIVVFTGRKGGGKDTCAAGLKRYLARCQYNIPGPLMGVAQVNFADKLRELLVSLFGLTSKQLGDPSLKEVKVDKWPYQTPRYIMQRFANSVRVEWPDIWVHHWLMKAELELQIGNYIIVCTDLRYPNERVVVETLAHSREIPFVVIHIDRPSLGKPTDMHESESYVGKLGHHVVISNTGTIEELYKKVPKAIAAGLIKYHLDNKEEMK